VDTGRPACFSACGGRSRPVYPDCHCHLQTGHCQTSRLPGMLSATTLVLQIDRTFRAPSRTDHGAGSGCLRPGRSAEDTGPRCRRCANGTRVMPRNSPHKTRSRGASHPSRGTSCQPPAGDNHRSRNDAALNDAASRVRRRRMAGWRPSAAALTGDPRDECKHAPGRPPDAGGSSIAPCPTPVHHPQEGTAACARDPATD
jgi:hypothetical protein